MAGGVELRNHSDVALRGIAQNFHKVRVRIITVGRAGQVIPVQGGAVGGLQGVGFRDGAILVQDRQTAVGTVGGKLREGVNLHAPPFVVPHMQVQDIGLVPSH